MFVFFNDTATTEIYTLSLHDALPICSFTIPEELHVDALSFDGDWVTIHASTDDPTAQCPCCGQPSRRRSEEHTSELQSRQYLVCRLLLEKKKNVFTLITPFYFMPRTS